MAALDERSFARDLCAGMSARMNGGPVRDSIRLAVDDYAHAMAVFMDAVVAASNNPCNLPLVQAVEDSARDVRLTAEAMREQVGLLVFEKMGMGAVQ